MLKTKSLLFGFRSAKLQKIPHTYLYYNTYLTIFMPIFSLYCANLLDKFFTFDKRNTFLLHSLNQNFCTFAATKTIEYDYK